MSDSEGKSDEKTGEDSGDSKAKKDNQRFIRLQVGEKIILTVLKNPSDSDQDKEDGENKNKADSSDDESDKKKSGDDEKSSDSNDDKDDKKKGPPLYKRPVFIVVASIVLLLLIVGGIVIWLIARQYVSTDDAYIDTHVVQVSPQIAAPVLTLHINDNQMVHKGDLLIELDPTDYLVALQQAHAQVSTAQGRLEQARAQIATAQASVPQAEAQQHSAEASLDNATRDLQRYQQVDERARSRQQLDNAATTQTNAQARLEETHAQLVSAQANVVTAQAAVKAAIGDVEAAEASQKKAEVNLSYCKIFAPADGQVTERTVEAGNYVTTGQALFLLVDPNVWVTANFKETQLTHMRTNQPVTIKVDAYPGTKFRGHVDSIQAGSGSRFSVLPAENATGNYVKVVQRVPVKIVFDHEANTNNAPLLSPGLSVIPRVKVR